MPEMPVLALDIGGTTLRAATVLAGRVIRRVTCPTPRPGLPADVLDAVTELARPFAQEAAALGVAFAGAVVDGGVTATAFRTFPEWNGIPVGPMLASRLNLPAVVLNDARAAAWGEAVHGAGRGCSEFMFVTVSTGVGAGLVLRGELHLARNGLDAELGFTSVPGTVRGSYDVPGVGPLAPLEFVASGSALDLAASDLGLRGARELADRAEEGDPVAVEFYDRSAALLAWRASDVAALLGVTRVAFGGSVGLRPGYLARIRTALSHVPSRFRPEAVAAELGEDAGLVGVASWASRHTT